MLGCEHLVKLELARLRGEVEPPEGFDPFVQLLAELGARHEAAYVASLEAGGKRVVRIDTMDPGAGAERTLAAMREGAEVIVQGWLQHGEWCGRTDVLRRVEGTSALGRRYEVEDTKLSAETSAATILQLCVYSEILGTLQDSAPEGFWVVTPGEVDAQFRREHYRLADYRAYHRLIRERLVKAVTDGGGALSAQPDPVRWLPRCEDHWRAQDHLSLVAGITRVQRRELERVGVTTMAGLAQVPVPLQWRPRRASAEALERARHQARVQDDGRQRGRLIHELLEVEADRGLALLPPPSPGDVFLDLEGDPFARRGGREYLFGLVRRDAACNLDHLSGVNLLSILEPSERCSCWTSRGWPSERRPTSQEGSHDLGD